MFQNGNLKDYLMKVLTFSYKNSDPTIKNCLSGAATLTKNADIDKYGYTG